MTQSATQECHRKYTAINLAADRARRGRLDFVLDRYSVQNADVLDIGCGPGVQFLASLESNRFTGMDISAEALGQAKTNGYKHTLQWDLSQDLPLDDGTFDVVVLTDILEHMIEPEQLLLEARRMLRPGGIMIVSVPNHFFLWNRLRIMMGRGLILPWSNHQEYEDWNYFHYRFFRRESIRSLLDTVGLCVDSDYAGHFLAPLPPIGPLNYVVKALRRWPLRKSVDLWTLHFMFVCKHAGECLSAE